MAFSINQPIGTNYRADPDDIMNTKRALARLGHYKVPADRGIDDWADGAMFDGIRSFQKANGLKVDAFMRPDGPTAKAINNHVQLAGSPQDEGWQHQSDMNSGGDIEFDVNGPVRVDTHNPSAGLNGARYHVDWHALDEKGNVIPEYRNADKQPDAYPGHLAPFGTDESVFKPPHPSPNGHRVRVWYPPAPEYTNHPGSPYLKIYRKK